MSILSAGTWSDHHQAIASNEQTWCNIWYDQVQAISMPITCVPNVHHNTIKSVVLVWWWLSKSATLTASTFPCKPFFRSNRQECGLFSFTKESIDWTIFSHAKKEPVQMFFYNESCWKKTPAHHLYESWMSMLTKKSELLSIATRKTIAKKTDHSWAAVWRIIFFLSNAVIFFDFDFFLFPIVEYSNILLWSFARVKKNENVLNSISTWAKSINNMIHWISIV